MSTAQKDSVMDFLRKSRTNYLDDVREGRGRNWIVTMGNEAGDLDSIASSVALAWCLSQTRDAQQVVALVQTPREDLKLRPENLDAFDLAGLNAEALLCIDDVPDSKPFPSIKFALVDHNRLLTRFSEENLEAQVIAVVDHHEDEGKHTDADPRIVQVPTGSAASLVAEHIRSAGLEIPPEISTLLLSAILIDTGGLKPNGKAEKADRDAASYLLPRSTLQTAGFTASSLREDEPIYQSQTVLALTQRLSASKADISHFGMSEHLRRDYKQYTWTLAPEGRTIAVGLSTVPVDLRTLLSSGSLQNDFWAPLDQFMDIRGLDVLGILTTFYDSKKKHGGSKSASGVSSGSATSSSAKKGKHKRQMLFVVRDATLEERLWSGIQKSDALNAEERLMRKYATKFRTKEEKHKIAEDGGANGRIAKVYKQGNANATRKIIAPLLQQIFEGKNGSPSA